MSFLVALVVAAAPTLNPAELKNDKLLGALVEELERSRQRLPSTPEAPVYYLSYRVADVQSFTVGASLGALVDSKESIDPLAGKSRVLDVGVRVGSRKLDNSHQLRGVHEFDFPRGGGSLPIDDEPRALRIGLWRSTDRAWRAAVKQLLRVKTNLQVKVSEVDQVDDFSADPPTVKLEPKWGGTFDRADWSARLKKLSALFKAHPQILDSREIGRAHV
jgi:hypothetical protein